MANLPVLEGVLGGAAPRPERAIGEVRVAAAPARDDDIRPVASVRSRFAPGAALDLEGRPGGALERLALAAAGAHHPARPAREGDPAHRGRAPGGRRERRRVPHGHHAVLRRAHGPGRPELPDPAAVGADHGRADDRARRPRGSARRGAGHAGAGDHPPVPGSRALLHHAQLPRVLPALHAQAQGVGPDERRRQAPDRGVARVHRGAPGDPRRGRSPAATRCRSPTSGSTTSSAASARSRTSRSSGWAPATSSRSPSA